MFRNRWSVLIGSIIVQVSIGTIYTWSLFNQSLMNQLNRGEETILLTYSISIFVFALSTMLSGRLHDRFGARIVSTIGGVLLGLGYLLSSTATSVYHLYLYYGVFVGMGVGFSYVCPLSTSMKWFPNNKGVISGIVVGAFGLGSLVYEPIIEALLSHNELKSTFFTLGIIYFIMIVLGSQLLVTPNQTISNSNKHDTKDFTVSEMIKTKSFYALWVFFLLGCTSGLLIIGQAKDIGIEMVQLDPLIAAKAVGVIALFNASGRILWGLISDKIGRLRVVSYMFILTTVALGLLATITLNAFTFFLLVSIIGFCFGGFLSVFPIITSEYYGGKNFGSNYGVMYQAYGVAALIGPLLLATTRNIESSFIVAAFLTILGAILVMIYKSQVHKENI